MRLHLLLILGALLATACESTPTAPTAPAPAEAPAPSVAEAPAPAPAAPYCGGEAVSSFRPNLGADGYVTFNFERIAGINIYQVEVQSRDEFGVYGRSGDWGKVIDTDNFATQRERIDPSLETRTFRARIRSFNNCGSFGAWSPWVEFGA